MKSIRVQQTYYTLPELYRVAAGSKARRGLAGYMIKTGRGDNTVFGGAMALLCGLETLDKHEVYTLDRHENAQTNREILSLAEAAMAGCFHPDYELSEREVRRMIRALDNLPTLEG